MFTYAEIGVRDAFACFALTGLLSSDEPVVDEDNRILDDAGEIHAMVARLAYEYADEMIKARMPVAESSHE